MDREPAVEYDRTVSVEALVDSWNLGQRFLMPDLQNHVMDYIVDVCAGNIYSLLFIVGGRENIVFGDDDLVPFLHMASELGYEDPWFKCVVISIALSAINFQSFVAQNPREYATSDHRSPEEDEGSRDTGGDSFSKVGVSPQAYGSGCSSSFLSMTLESDETSMDERGWWRRRKPRIGKYWKRTFA